MTFEFIDSRASDALIRKKIRSHVMKGKNVGKVRTAKTRSSSTRVVSHFKPVEAVDDEVHRNDRSVVLRHVEYLPLSIGYVELLEKSAPQWSLGHEMGMWPFAVRIGVEEQRTVHNFLLILSYALYPNMMCVRPEISKLIWFQYLFMDEAFLSAALALSEIFNTAIAGRKEEPVVAIKHLSRAFTLLSKNIEAQGTSDLIIATVLYISLGERMKGQYERGQIHVCVLKKMVALRGGIKEILKNQALVQKIFLADIESAIHDGTPTHFNVAEIPGEDTLRMLHTQAFPTGVPTSTTSIRHTMSGPTRQIFEHLIVLAEYSRRTSDIPRLTYPEFGEVLTRIDYKVLALSHSTALVSITPFDHLAQLAIQTLMISFWHTPCIKHQPFQLLGNSLKSAINLALESHYKHLSFLLWTMFIGACSLFRDFDDSWFEKTVLKIVVELGLETFEELLQMLDGFPWIDAFHERTARRLWSTIEEWRSGRSATASTTMTLRPQNQQSNSINFFQT